MEPIEIKDFNLGIGKSEFEGNGLIMNADTDWRPGVTRIALEATNSSAGTVTAQVNWIVANEDVTDQRWAYDVNNNVYRGTAEAWSLAFTNGAGAGGQGTIVWKDYLIINKSTNIFGYGPLSGSASIYTIGNLEGDLVWHPIIKGQDDILYIGNTRYIATLKENSGQDFQAGTAATFSFSSQALDLPEGYRVRCLGELGKYVMAGTWKGTNIYDFKVADIFPWDRTSDSYNLPIKLQENGVHAMLSKDNFLYFFAGTEGKLFRTDGSNVEELAKIPQQINDLSGGNNVEVYPGAMIYHKGKILFGLGAGGDGTSAQVWGYNLETKAMKIENTVSSGTATGNRMSALLGGGTEDYWIGYLSNSDSGNLKRIDHIQSGGNARRYSNYSSVVTSPYYQMGTSKKPEITSQIEVVLARPLASGQGVRLSYRTDLSASFTLAPGGTVDFASYGAIQGQIIPFQVEVKQGIQIRAELTTSSGSSTSPDLIKLLVS